MPDSGGWLLAVDGTGLYVRCSRAAQRHPLTAPDGTPTGALLMFAGSLAAVVREVQPERLLITWDGPGGVAWRRETCPEYKRNRAPYDRWSAERDMRPFDAVREFCGAAAIEQWSLDDFEGDDMLAYASREAARLLPATQVIIASDDKDTWQLAERDRVWVRALGRDGGLVDDTYIETATGVPPEHLPKLRALSGDPSDGIAGVAGVGPVRALTMLRQARYEWPLPEAVLPEASQREAADRWYAVMNLLDPPKRPEDTVVSGILDIRKTHWKRGNVLPVLERYGMNHLAERYSKGLLW